MRGFIPFAVLALAAGCQQSPLAGGHEYDQATLKFFPENLATLDDVVQWESVDDDNALVTLQASRLLLETVTLDERPYTQLRVPGYRSESQRGKPEIPSVDFLIRVPRGKRLTFEILAESRNDRATLDHPAAFQHRAEVHNGQLDYVRVDVEAYRSAYGMSAIEILEESYAETEKFAKVRYYPLAYDAPVMSVQLRRETKVHLEFVEVAQLMEEQPPVGGDATSVFSAFALNQSDATYMQKAGDPRDLIIADESYRSALQPYIEFKKARGRQVIEEYVSRATTGQVKQLIRQHYQSATPPRNTLLVGNIDQIASFRGSGDNTWTDWPYQTLDGGSLPDVSLGRVPAHNTDELTAWMQKATARETHQRDTGKVLLTAGNDVSMGCPANVSQVGQNLQSGGNVQLTKQYRSEGASTEAVFAAYNQNPNLIVYDGHGFQDGMSEIPLLMKDMPRLTNQSFPIILDIACLNANWKGGAKARNFAETILLTAGKGAAGIMAAGGSSGGHQFFQNIGSIMAQARQAGTSHSNKLNEIGQVILAAKARANGSDQGYFNYYGDPATSVWESPASTEPVTNQTVTASDVFAALDAQNALYVSVAADASAPEYCEGTAAACAAGSWSAMTRSATRDGRAIYRSADGLSLTDGKAIQLRSGTLHQGLRIRSR